MAMIYFHADKGTFPNDTGLMHGGFWYWTLPDNTYLIGMKCGHIPTARVSIANKAIEHGLRARVMPSVASKASIHPEILASLISYLGLTGITALTTAQALSGICAKQYDPMFDPEGLP